MQVAILAALDHPHIVRYLHSVVDRSEASEGRSERGELRIWMEYAPGGSLEQAIQTQAKLRLGFSTGRVCTWAIQLADALDHVHSRRVLHRDLKTANVFLTHAGDVKLGARPRCRRRCHRFERAPLPQCTFRSTASAPSDLDLVVVTACRRLRRRAFDRLRVVAAVDAAGDVAGSLPRAHDGGHASLLRSNDPPLKICRGRR